MIDFEDRTIAAGSLMLMTFGSYSDYRVNALVVVLKTFTTVGVRDEYVAGLSSENLKNGVYAYDHDRLLPWMIRQGYVAELQWGEWCLGGCQLFDEDGHIKPAFEVKP